MWAVGCILLLYYYIPLKPTLLHMYRYDCKDDMWAVGCILSELLTNTPIPSRCGGGVFSFNQALVQKTIEDSVKASPHLGRCVAQLLAIEADKTLKTYFTTGLLVEVFLTMVS